MKVLQAATTLALATWAAFAYGQLLTSILLAALQ